MTSRSASPGGDGDAFSEGDFVQAVLESLDAGIVACDADGRLSLFNRATREMHGVEAASVGPEEWVERFDLYQADAQTPMATEDVPLLRALRGERVRDVEMVIAPKDRPVRRVLCSGQAVRHEDGRVLGAVVALHDVTERVEAQRRLTHQALHDDLTGLPNRALLLDRLEQALLRDRGTGQACVLSLNLDDFKAINEEHGRQVGDQALIAIAERLRSALRDEDTVARTDAPGEPPRPGHTVGRLGGDEFVVVLEGRPTPADAARVAERVLRKVQAPISVGGRALGLSISVGVALGRGSGDGGAEELMREADTAMYDAKRNGKGRVQMFNVDLHQQLVARVALIEALGTAAERDQLRLLYQPLVDVASGSMKGVEALVRWQHPERGLLTPDQFLSEAEGAGLIDRIDDWVMREACAQMRRWDRAGLPPLQMAVNISARRLVTGDLANDLAQVLGDADVRPQRLEIEITETVAVEHDNEAVAAIGRLRALGVRVAIDDFGMGHSALSRLQSFPVDRLKIDRAFISPLTSRGARGSIAEAMIAIGHSLGLEVVAEGVETREHLHALRALACQYAQGYLFSKPVPHEAIADIARTATSLVPGPISLSRLTPSTSRPQQPIKSV
jgi:PAS domain S-box-containing protein